MGIASGGDEASTGVPGTGQVTALDSPVPAGSVPLETVTADDQVQIGNAVVEKVPLGRVLDDGIVGDDVSMVQQRLKDLAFDPGPVDGYYGTLTVQAVWAFEKLVMGTPRPEATGRVTPEMWDRMQDPITIQPRRPTGGLADHTEIYLPEQVMIVFHGDRPALVTHVSTGELLEGATSFTPWWENAAEYCETVVIDTDDNGVPLEEPIEKAICGRSYTPPGVFQAYKKVAGRRESRLGGMYDPIYINQGIAIHGALNVPIEPASHGCIRVSQYIGSFLQTLLDIGDQVLIWDGETEPERQPEEATRMRWDYPDPNASTTTSTTSTTTTVPVTTVAPATTVATTTPPTTTTSSTTSTTIPGDEG